LILGLSDGSVINAGVAQGPMGLTGPQGPVGATGRPGRDGNTIHSVEGAPSYDLGTDGDFAINTVEWEVYGPKASGQWGKGTPMLGGGGRNKREVNKGGDTRTDSGSGDGRPPIISPDGDLTPPTQYPGAKPIKDGDFWVDGNGALHVYYRGGWHKVRVYSDMVLPAGDAPAGSSRDVEGGVIVPGNGGTGQAIAEAANGEQFANQYEFNNWLYYRVDRPPIVADDEPAEHPNFPVTGLSAGDFWINAGDQLFTWKANQWTPLFAKGLLTVQDTMPDPAESQEGELWFNTEETHLTLYVFTQPDPNEEGLWVPAAPPVSLDGIEGNIYELQENVRYIQKNMTPFEAHQELYGKHEHLEATQAEQDEKLNELGSSTSNNSDRLDEIDEKFEELDRTLAVGKWRFLATSSTNNPQNGQFTLAALDGGQPVRTWTQVAFATIAKVDEAGVTHEIQTWASGDRIEFYSTMDDGHAVFTIGDYAGLDTQLRLASLLESYGEPIDRNEYRIRHFAAGDGIGFDEADQRYVNATGDTMTGPLKLKQKSTNSTVLNFNDETDHNFFGLRSEAAPQEGGPGTTARLNIAKGKQFKIVSLEADKQLFKIYKNGNVFLGSLIAPTEDTHAANKKYVDDSIAGISSGNTSYLPLSGGTLTGGLTAPSLMLELGKSANQMGFEVRSGISNTSTMWVDKSGTNLYVKGDVYAVCSSNSNNDEQYKGRRLATINLVEKIEEHPGYQMRWKYTDGDVKLGYFRIGGNFIYIDRYDHDRKDLLAPMCAKDHGASDAGGIMTIYEIVSNKYKPVQVWQIERSRFGYTEDSRRTVQLEALGGHKPLEGTLTANSIYYITFGGLF